MRCSDALVVDGGLGGSSRVSYAGSYGTEPLAGSAGWRGGNHANAAVPACVRRSRAIGRPAAARSGQKEPTALGCSPPNLGQRQANGRDERLCGTDAHSPDPAEAAPLAQYPAARRHGGRWRVVARCQSGRRGWSQAARASDGGVVARRSLWSMDGPRGATPGRCVQHGAARGADCPGCRRRVVGIAFWACRGCSTGCLGCAGGVVARNCSAAGVSWTVSVSGASSRRGRCQGGQACRGLRVVIFDFLTPDGFYDPPGNAPCAALPPAARSSLSRSSARAWRLCWVVPRASRVRRIG
ncbi:hypothetical protein SAMN04489713_1011051 [Actinomadura madurae]|uniref:Uncharacterized protein n=1 Tax=Actinomadura madurae TaxID=1993 RepID=A0A1I4XVX3_9ACTN|nr:hypothetical protein SAMN04489713_1011051 [Actinomadura madurae]